MSEGHPATGSAASTSRSSPRSLFFLIFTLSGFSGLIYESLWTHYLKLFLGHAAYAQTLVLSIFMGGMAAGSWWCSRNTVRLPNLLRRYAVAEGLVGLFALAFHRAFDSSVTLSYDTLIPALQLPWLVTLYKWTLATLLILPQSVLLGMTFPLMTGGLVRRFPERPGESVAGLYFVNSLGGAVGVLVSGFLLIGWVGLPGTGSFAGLINLALAVTVWRLAGAQPEPSGAADERGEGLAHERGMHRIMLVVALLTGTASFIYEVGWIRMLSLVLGSSTHAFELMLSAFILGLAFGGLWIRRRIDTIAEPVAFLGNVQVAMGALAMATLLLYNRTFDVMRWLVATLPKTDWGYVQFSLASHGLAMAIMLPATFCAGMTLPLITYVLLRGGYGERSIGAVYAWNTVGAIAGVWFAVQVGMPHLGLKNLIVAGGALDVSLGLVLFWRARARTGTRRFAASALVASGVLLVALTGAHFDVHKMASGVFRGSQGVLTAGNSTVVFHRDGKTSTVDLVDDRAWLTIRTNGKIDAAVNLLPGGVAGGDESTMVLSGALPLLLHPKPKKVANIGFGSGISTHVLLTDPGIERVDTIEIEAAMVEAARGFWPRNERAYTDPRSHIRIDDAKTFFSTHGTRYDIIVSEPSNPWVSGVAGLFSVEFYRLVTRHLAQDGLFVQWLQIYEFDLPLVATVLKALSASFNDFRIYAANEGDILIVAVPHGGVPMPRAERFRNPDLARELHHVDVRGVRDIDVRFLGDVQLLGPLLDRTPVPANSDYFPYLDQHAAVARFQDRNAGPLVTFTTGPIPVLSVLGRQMAPAVGTRVTPSRRFRASRLAHEALAFRDLLASSGGGSPTLPSLRGSEALRLWGDCMGLTARDDRRPFFFELAWGVVPYLTVPEWRESWERLGALPCRQGLVAAEAMWSNLVDAVGRRDVRSMTAHAEALLEESGERKERLAYLAGVALLGRVASGDVGVARELWTRYEPAVRADAVRFLGDVLLAYGEEQARPAGEKPPGREPGRGRLWPVRR